MHSNHMMQLAAKRSGRDVGRCVSIVSARQPWTLPLPPSLPVPPAFRVTPAVCTVAVWTPHTSLAYGEVGSNTDAHSSEL